MTLSSCDALVIGSGQAGTPLAVRLAEHGWKTVLVERGELDQHRLQIGRAHV